MLIGAIVAVVVAGGLVVGVLWRRRSNDDVHSVEHYHRQLHTLESMRAHPAGSGLREAAGASSGAATAVAGGAPGNGKGDEHATTPAGANGSGGPATTEVADAPSEHDEQLGEEGSAAAAVAGPASALRASGSSTVRLTDADRPPPPPPPPPPLRDLSSPPRVDDADAETLPGTFMSRSDRAMESINHRPRRLGGPLAAIAVVIVLVVVLIVTGLHTTPSRSHPGSGSSSPATRPSVTATTGHPHTRSHTTQPVTPTTAPPVVSAPSATSATGATYTVGSPTYALALTATSGPCWVQVTDTSGGSVLFSTTLYGGQSHTVTATGPVMVQVGAPNAFSATVNGAPVTLPPGFQAPFTLKFQTAAGTGPA